MIQLFQGIFSAMVTPYGPDGQVSPERTAALADYNVANGVDGIFLCGTTGEFPLLSLQERQTVTAAAAKAVAGRAKLLVNVSSLCMSETSTLIRQAKDLGADAVSLVAPYYYPFDDEALFRFFSWAAQEAQPLPLYLYNIPSHCRNKISADLLARLTERCPNLHGIKDSSMDPQLFLDYMSRTQGRLSILTGDDSQVLWSLQNGGNGAVLASACVFPRLVKELYTDFLEGRIAQAAEKQKKIHHFRQVCRATIPGIAHKKALEIFGLPMGRARAPFRDLNQEEEQLLRRTLEEEGLLSYVSTADT